MQMNIHEAQLVGALIGLVRATDGATNITENTYSLVISGLAALSGENTDEMLANLTEEIHADKHRIVPDCSVCGAPCGRTADYDFQRVCIGTDDISMRKQRILKKLVQEASRQGGKTVDADKCRLWCKAVFALGEDWSLPELRALEGELIDCENRA